MCRGGVGSDCTLCEQVGHVMWAPSEQRDHSSDKRKEKRQKLTIKKRKEKRRKQKFLDFWIEVVFFH